MRLPNNTENSLSVGDLIELLTSEAKQAQSVLGKSSQMPGFGGMLKPEELRAVVQHLRVLCACEGPAWSKDVPQ